MVDHCCALSLEIADTLVIYLRGGLGLPCSYRFSGSRKLIEKIKFRLIELGIAVTDTASNCGTTENESVISPALGTESTEEKHTPVQIVHSEDTEVECHPGIVWVQIKDIVLSIEDRQLILDKQQLIDKHINGALRLIHEQFLAINGLVLTFLQNRPLHGSSVNAIQIFHVRGDHWIVVATSNKGKVVTVYDSHLYLTRSGNCCDDTKVFPLQSMQYKAYTFSKAGWISRLWIICNS